MTTDLSFTSWHPCQMLFRGLFYQRDSSPCSSQVCDFQSKNGCGSAAEKPGQVLVSVLPTQEEKTEQTAGVEAGPRPPGANGAGRSGWLKYHHSESARGMPPPACASSLRFREACTPGWAASRGKTSLAAVFRHKIAAQAG